MMDTANSEMIRLLDLSAKQGRRIAELEAERAKDREAMQAVLDVLNTVYPPSHQGYTQYRLDINEAKGDIAKRLEE